MDEGGSTGLFRSSFVTMTAALSKVCMAKVGQ